MALHKLFSVFLILLYHHRIWYFPMMGVHVSKERGGFQEIQEGEMKKERGGDTRFHTMIYIHICLSKINHPLYEYQFLSIDQIKHLLVCLFIIKTAYFKTWNNQIRPDSTRNQSRIKQNLSVAVHFLFRII